MIRPAFARLARWLRQPSALATAADAIRRGSEAIGPGDVSRAAVRAYVAVTTAQIARRSGGTMAVEARATGVPGLVVTACGRVWQLTHQVSGEKIAAGRHWPTADDAAADARLLAGGVDWTRSADELRRDERARAADARLVRGW